MIQVPAHLKPPSAAVAALAAAAKPAARGRTPKAAHSAAAEATAATSDSAAAATAAAVAALAAATAAAAADCSYAGGSGTWVGVHSALANTWAANLLAAGVLPLPRADVRREVAYGPGQRSRVDFLLTQPGSGQTYVEVKAVTLAEDAAGARLLYLVVSSHLTCRCHCLALLVARSAQKGALMLASL